MEAIKINIAKPCDQKWGRMITSTNGRFCKSCKKQVVDFDSMTDGELLSFFIQSHSVNVCGRMAADQVDRPIYINPLRGNKKWYWPILAYIFILFGRSANAQTNTGEIAIQEQPVKKPLSHHQVINLDKAISVKVLNTQGVGIAGAVIYVSNAGKSFTTGKDGTVAFLVSENDKSFSVSNPGFVTRNIILSNKMHYILNLQSTCVQPKPAPIIMGKMVIRKL